MDRGRTSEECNLEDGTSPSEFVEKGLCAKNGVQKLTIYG